MKVNEISVYDNHVSVEFKSKLGDKVTFLVSDDGTIDVEVDNAVKLEDLKDAISQIESGSLVFKL